MPPRHQGKLPQGSYNSLKKRTNSRVVPTKGHTLRDIVVMRRILRIWAPGSIPGRENPFFSNPIIVSVEFFELFFMIRTPYLRLYLSNRTASCQVDHLHAKSRLSFLSMTPDKGRSHPQIARRTKPGGSFRFGNEWGTSTARGSAAQEFLIVVQLVVRLRSF